MYRTVFCGDEGPSQKDPSIVEGRRNVSSNDPKTKNKDIGIEKPAVVLNRTIPTAQFLVPSQHRADIVLPFREQCSRL
jgi:hypothetical protein